MSNPIVLFDMDGTLCDYEGAMLQRMNELRAPYEPPITTFPDDRIPHLAARMKLIKNQPGFWRELPRLEDGYDILDFVSKFTQNVHVLTKGPWATHAAWTEKVEWCRHNLPHSVKVTITEEKGIVYGKMLVDDWPPYIESWLAHRPRGLVVMPDRTYNRDFEHPQVLRYMRTTEDPSCYATRKRIEAHLSVQNYAKDI